MTKSILIIERVEKVLIMTGTKISLSREAYQIFRKFREAFRDRLNIELNKHNRRNEKSRE